jgi:hypothetical protein
LKSLATNAGKSRSQNGVSSAKVGRPPRLRFRGTAKFAAWRRTLEKKSSRVATGGACTLVRERSECEMAIWALQQRRQGVREQILASMPPFLTHPLLQDYFLREKSGMSPCTPDPTLGNVGYFEVQHASRAHTPVSL